MAMVTTEERAAGGAKATSVAMLHGASARLALGLFTGALFLSAFLLFGVQPMFTKMVLPTLGGTPAVWSVAMVFFQALLLAGYCYAHLLVRHAGVKLAALVHLGVMAAAFLTMPIAMAQGWGRPPADGEAIWLLGLFAVSVGAPFFAVSANGPLLQAWFARSGHPQAGDPYFLYAASNIGSFVALAAYPLVIEPTLPLAAQSGVWTAGFVALALLITACAALVALRRGEAHRASAAIMPAAGAEGTSWADRLSWVALAFVPSGLLVAVTAHISTDVASAPLLWVVPLALFLLTFVVAFREAAWLSGPFLMRLQVWGTALALLSFAIILPLWMGLTTHLVLFFVVALVAHHELYRRRPDVSRLTEFYLWMSLGGVLGGAFCGLVAPNIFSFVLEYPLLLVAGLFCRRGFVAAIRERRQEFMWLALAALGLIGAAYIAATMLGRSENQIRLAVVVLFIVVMMAMWRVPARAAVAALAAMLTVAFSQGALLEMTTLRSFFGVHKVATTLDGRFRSLTHGTTMHGAIRIRHDDGSEARGRPEPTTYYTFEGGIGQAIAGLRAARGGLLPRVAAVGLGSGSVSCHIRPGEDWRFFEIDPDVVRIAQDPAMFRFLRDCAPAPVPIVLGDARLTLGDDEGRLSAILIDAFSSDSIPAHLITREAFGLYLSKLDPKGAIIVHISNRHLDLRQIVARAGAAQGLATYVITDETEEPFTKRYRAPSIVAVLAREPGDLGPLAANPAWTKIRPDLTRRPWTDDFSNIIEAMRDKAAQ